MIVVCPTLLLLGDAYSYFMRSFLLFYIISHRPYPSKYVSSYQKPHLKKEESKMEKYVPHQLKKSEYLSTEILKAMQAITSFKNIFKGT